MKSSFLKVILFPLDLVFLTLDSWVITFRRIKRILKKEKDQPCHFCQGDDHSESPHPVRSVLKYQNGWLVKLLSPCIRFKRIDGRRVAMCKQEGGFTRPPAIVPLVAVLMLTFWLGGSLGILYGLSSDKEHFWGNFVTFFSPSSMSTGEDDEVDFLEAGDSQLNPERAERYYRDGIKALDQFKFPDAQVSLKRAIQNFPTDPKYHYSLARAFFGTRQFVDGEASLRRALEFDAEHVDALLMLAELLQGQEKAGEAYTHASKALELEPDNLRAVRMNAALLAARGDKETVRGLMEQLKTEDGENADTLTFLGRLEFSLYQDFEASEALLNASLEINQDHVGALMAMIPIHAQKKDMDSVNETMNRVLELQPENLQALRLQAEMMMSRYGLGVGLRYYGNLMTRFGNDPTLRLRYAELLLQSGNITEGKRLAEQLTASRIPNIERTSHWMLAQMYAQIRMYDDAIKHAQDTLRVAPGARNVQVFLAQQYLQSGEGLLAKRALERAIVNQENLNPNLYILMSRILQEMDEEDEAIAYLDGVLAENADLDRVRMRKVEIQMQTPQWQSALPDTRLLHEKYPDDPALRNNLAFLLARSGQELDKAQELVESLKDQFDQNPVILDTYGFVLAAAGKHEQAIEVYEQALEKAGGNMTIRFHYAVSLAALGRSEEALRQLEAVLIIQPNFPQADDARSLQSQLSAGA